MIMDYSVIVLSIMNVYSHISPSDLQSVKCLRLFPGHDDFNIAGILYRQAILVTITIT